MRPQSNKRNYRSLEHSTSPHRTRRSFNLKTQQSPNKNPMRRTFIASIKKAVKNNDIRLLIQERDKMRTEPPESTNFINEQAHQTLVEVRKKYDAMKMQRIKLGNVAMKLQKQVKKYEQMEKQLKDKIDYARNSQQNSIQLRDNFTFNMESLLQDKKVLESMKQRLNQDRIYYLHHINVCKKKMYHYTFQKNNLQNQLAVLKVQTKNAQNLMEKVKKVTVQQTTERRIHLGQVSTALDQKNFREMAEKTRTQFENDTAQKTLLSKNEEQTNWINLLHTHLFVKQLLKTKIVNEMKKFQVVQKCFFEIKGKTEVKTPEQLVTRFLNRTQIYDDLLDQVARLKKNKSDLKQEETFLTNQNIRLLNEKQKFDNILYFNQSNKLSGMQMMTQIDNSMEYLMQKWSAKALENETMLQNMERWVKRSTKKLCKNQKLEISYRNDHLSRKEYLAKNMKNFLHQISKVLEAAAKDKITDFDIQLPIKQAETKRTQRLMQQILADEQKQLSTFETQKNDDENGAISAQREAILMKNSRFMKEVRARHKSAKLRTIEKQAIVKK